MQSRIALLVTTVLGVLYAMLATLACSANGPGQAALSRGEPSPPGAVLAMGEGERRRRRPPPGQLSSLSAPFILKVDPQTLGASDFVMFYEDIPPGQAIALHHHPGAEEILFVHKGTGLASLGTRTSPVSEGATIFIPRNVRATLRNTGAEPLGIVAMFSRPGFEQYLRAISVPEGEEAKPLSVDELQAIRARYTAHVIYDHP